MQRRVNVLVPLGCPHCEAELTVTLDQLREERRIWCVRCRTMVQLRPENLVAQPLAGDLLPPARPQA